MAVTLNEFKMLVAEQLKQIRESNARLIEQEFVQNKDIILQTINQNMTEQLKNLSPAGMGGSKDQLDKLAILNIKGITNKNGIKHIWGGRESDGEQLESIYRKSQQ